MGASIKARPNESWCVRGASILTVRPVRLVAIVELLPRVFTASVD
jgi:hypothetical protein